MIKKLVIAGLFLSSSAFADSYGYSHKNLKHIMDNKTANMMQFSDNSKHMPHERLVFGNFHGRDALKITLKQSDIGSIGDAGRNMGWGNAQRIQIREKEYKREMLDGKEYWYKVSVFMPKNLGSDNHTVSLFDLKLRKNKQEGTQVFSWNITNDELNFQLETGDWLCWTRKIDGGANRKQCSFKDNFISIPKDNYRNKWVDVVMQINMIKGKELFRVWANDELILSFAGDINPFGRELGFKFGLYRHHMTTKLKDDVAYYSDIKRGKSCSDLNVNCDKFMNDFSGLGAFNMQKVLHVEKYVENNGPKLRFNDICYKKECENLTE